MSYRTQMPSGLFSELDRLQRDIQQAFGVSPSIRGGGRGSFPVMNIGHTAGSLEIYVFVPGVDPQQMEVHVEKGVLVIAGQREVQAPQDEERSIVHIDERFEGRFRRVVTLPDDIDPDQIEAHYRDGVLHIGIKRRQAAQPRQISIQ